MSNEANFEEQLAARGRNDRPLYVFKIPPRLSAESGIKEIGIVELRASEELIVTRSALGDSAKTAFELAKASFRQADGKPLSAFDGTVDKLWEDLKPAVRLLVLQAYNSVHQPKPEETLAFLSSREVRV